MTASVITINSLISKPVNFSPDLESKGDSKYDKSFLNLNIYRSGSYNPKTTDQERKVEELSQELKSLKEENRENKR